MNIILIITMIFSSFNLTLFPLYSSQTYKKKIQHVIAYEQKKRGVTPITYNQIPPFYYKTVVATEDRRFAWDPGVDPVGILRAALKDAELGKYAEGGSTITQQLVDNTILKRRKTISYKLKQTYEAIRFYDIFTKKQIFTYYVDGIYYGSGAYGIENAAETYFGEKINQLNAGQLSLLAGIPNAPTNYDPLKHLQLSLKRQKIVLENMVEDHQITEKKAKSIEKDPLQLK